jgi:hypothetical protein
MSSGYRGGRRHLPERLDVSGHGPCVASGDRAGQARDPQPQCVVQGSGKERAEQSRRIGDSRFAQQFG